MEETKYVESSIALSRNYQERANCLQGVTGYGTLASFIGGNMDYLDSFSEYVALCVSKNITTNIYESQYGEKIKGFVNRNLSSSERIDRSEKNRRNIAFLSSLLTEAGMKYGIRGLKVLAETQEKQKYFEMVYFILKSYLEESDQYIYYENANKELRKILKAFPIDVKKKQQLWNSESFDDCEKISDFAQKIDSDAKYSVAYLLYAIHAQKYGEQFVVAGGSPADMWTSDFMIFAKATTGEHKGERFECYYKLDEDAGKRYCEDGYFALVEQQVMEQYFQQVAEESGCQFKVTVSLTGEVGEKYTTDISMDELKKVIKEKDIELSVFCFAAPYLTDEEFDREVSLLEKALSDTGYRTEYCVWRLIDEDKFNYINTDSDISRAFPRGSRSDDLYNKRYDSDIN